MDKVYPIRQYLPTDLVQHRFRAVVEAVPVYSVLEYWLQSLRPGAVILASKG